MKRILFTLLMLTMCVSSVYATALTESGDTRTVPMSLYGTESDGSVTAMRVNSDGQLEMSLSTSNDITTSGLIYFTNLPTGATEPATVVLGQLWLDSDDQTVKIGT